MSHSRVRLAQSNHTNRPPSLVLPTNLWIGRTLLGLLIGLAAMSTLAFVTSGTRAVGILAQLIDSDVPTVVVLAKVLECSLYWLAVMAYLRGSRPGLLMLLLVFVGILLCDVVLNAQTPGFQIRYLQNHIDDLVPCVSIGALCCCLPSPAE